MRRRPQARRRGPAPGSTPAELRRGRGRSLERATEADGVRPLVRARRRCTCGTAATPRSGTCCVYDRTDAARSAYAPPRRHRRGRRGRAPSSSSTPAQRGRGVGRGWSRQLLAETPGRPAAAVGARRAPGARPRWPRRSGFTRTPHAAGRCAARCSPRCPSRRCRTASRSGPSGPGADDDGVARAQRPRVRRPPRPGPLDRARPAAPDGRAVVRPRGLLPRRTARRPPDGAARRLPLDQGARRAPGDRRHGHEPHRRGLRRRGRPARAGPRPRPGPHPRRACATCARGPARRDALRRRGQRRGHRASTAARLHPLGHRRRCSPCPSPRTARGAERPGRRVGRAARVSTLHRQCHHGAMDEPDRRRGRPLGTARREPTSRCPPTGSSTASCPGWRSTSGCSSWPRTPTCRCSSGPSSWRSSPATSTSSSWSGSPGSSGASPPASPSAPPAACMPREVLDGDLDRTRELHGPRRRACFRDEVLPGAGQGGHRDPALGRARPTTSAPSCRRVLRRADLPGADPAGRRPGAPVPVHLRAVAQPRRRRAQPEHRHRALRPGQGAADPAALRTRSAEQRFVPLEDVIAAHLDRAVPRHGGPAAAHLPRHPQRGRRGRGGRRREPAAGAGARADAPPVRAAGAPRGRATIDRPARARPAGARAGHRPTARSFALPGPLDLTGLMDRSSLDRARAEGPARSCRATSPRAGRGRDRRRAPDVLAAMRDHDVLLHHPYDSFSTSVQAFLEQAAADPQGAGDQADALPHQRGLPDRRRPHRRRRGRQAGARRSSRSRRASTSRPTSSGRASWSRPAATSSTAWSGSRRTASCQHGRPQDDGDRCAATSTSAPATTTRKTARLYEDLGLLTTDPAVGEDVSEPVQRAVRLLDEHRVRAAARRARTRCAPAWSSGSSARSTTTAPGGPPAIRFKCNSIVDEGIIDALYRASQAGVPVDIWVRGICALRPGVPGLSREHPGAQRSSAASWSTRGVYAFANGGDREMWIGSADLMHRNLDRRVEALVRLERPSTSAELGRPARPGLRRRAPRSWHLRRRTATWDRHAHARPTASRLHRHAGVPRSRLTQRRTGAPRERLEPTVTDDLPRGRAQAARPRPVPPARPAEVGRGRDDRRHRWPRRGSRPSSSRRRTTTPSDLRLARSRRDAAPARGRRRRGLAPQAAGRRRRRRRDGAVRDEVRLPLDAGRARRPRSCAELVLGLTRGGRRWSRWRRCGPSATPHDAGRRRRHRGRRAGRRLGLGPRRRPSSSRGSASSRSRPRDGTPTSSSTPWSAPLVASGAIAGRTAVQGGAGPRPARRSAAGHRPSPAPVRPGDPAGAAVQAHLAPHAPAFLSRRTCGVRRELPDSVHQMRVAARRLRSGLKVFGPLVDADVGRARCATSWPGSASELGGVRDREVLEERLLRDLARLPSGVAAATPATAPRASTAPTRATSRPRRGRTPEVDDERDRASAERRCAPPLPRPARRPGRGCAAPPGSPRPPSSRARPRCRRCSARRWQRLARDVEPLDARRPRRRVARDPDRRQAAPGTPPRPWSPSSASRPSGLAERARAGHRAARRAPGRRHRRRHASARLAAGRRVTGHHRLRPRSAARGRAGGRHDGPRTSSWPIWPEGRGRAAPCLAHGGD